MTRPLSINFLKESPPLAAEKLYKPFYVGFIKIV